ncbi:hypothetical protein SB775_21445 [Peribacillus sp. SIMBA_075]|uniref:hypothetical protein n=1 Tax=Peribacillus sp. SIMBA_075 TaxID=3085813 RepID=UPI0039794AEC
MSNNEKQDGKSNRRQGSEYNREHSNNDPDYMVHAWDVTNVEDSFVQSAIQEEFNNPVIQESILKFNKIANEEEKES